MLAISNPPNPTDIYVIAMPLISTTQKTLRNISHHETNGHHLDSLNSYKAVWLVSCLFQHMGGRKNSTPMPSCPWFSAGPDASFDSPHHSTQRHAASQIQRWNHGWIEATRNLLTAVPWQWFQETLSGRTVEDMESHILWFLDLKGFSC